MAGTAVAPGTGERVQGPAGLVPMGVGALALVYHLQDCDHDPVSSEVGVWWAVGAPACLLPACGLLPRSWWASASGLGMPFNLSFPPGHILQRFPESPGSPRTGSLVVRW